MRHPTTGLNEDDLSRLTGSSTTASTPSHESNDGSNHCSIIPIVDETGSKTNLKTSDTFNSTYLPEIIDPIDWQKSRKRKERQDSTSSTTQDRKLVRSNSEEFLPNADYEVIRRVASHEDFKKPLHEIKDDNILKTIQENDNVKQQHQQQEQKHNPQPTKTLKDMAKPARLDTSPARSYRVSPNRDHRNGKHKENNDDSEYEHEKRRSSERFCKSRAATGRKSGNYKKSTKYISRLRDRDDNAYKYDISAMKHERRGFVSKFKLEDRARKEEAADGEQIQRHDYNDNNLIDFHIKSDYMSLGNPICQVSPMPQSPTPPIQQQQQQQPSQPTSNSCRIESIAEALPWDCSIQEDQTPVLCRRFASFEEYGADNRATKLAIVSPALALNEAPKSCFGGSLAKLENFKTREIMQSIPPTGHFQSPDERLKYVNKKLTALKKRVTQLEENYERTYGYRPSQVEKFNDKQIKNVLTEISKLRKEKHELKSDPMMALGFRISGGMDPEQKLDKMKETLIEIEMKLNEKRTEGNWSENLDDLTPEQLVQEKTAVQHSLLYLESLYGRPATRDERDVVRPLYDRYRLIKRLVSRSITVAGTVSGIPELPTILEHEAMAFTVESIQQPPSVDTTDTTNSPDFPASLTVESSSDSGSNQSGGEISDTITNSSQQSENSAENIHTLSTDELWEQLEKVRDEKKELKRIIKEFEALFEVQNGRKMLKTDRRAIDFTCYQYKQKKAKVRLLQALIKKHISN